MTNPLKDRHGAAIAPPGPYVCALTRWATALHAELIRSCAARR